SRHICYTIPVAMRTKTEPNRRGDTGEVEMEPAVQPVNLHPAEPVEGNDMDHGALRCRSGLRPPRLSGVIMTSVLPRWQRHDGPGSGPASARLRWADGCHPHRQWFRHHQATSPSVR